MARMIKRLSNLDIDEISLVDRPANQHGLVAIAKRDEESTMSVTPALYDAEGYEVDPSEIGDGEYVYDENGNEYVNVIEDGADDGDYSDFEYESDEVGKAARTRVPLSVINAQTAHRFPPVGSGEGFEQARRGAVRARRSSNRPQPDPGWGNESRVSRVARRGQEAKEGARRAKNRADAHAAFNLPRNNAANAYNAASIRGMEFGATRLGGDRAVRSGTALRDEGRLAQGFGSKLGRRYQARGAAQRAGGAALVSYGNHPMAYIGGGTAAAGTAGGAYAYSRRDRDKVGKSYGEQVLEELSKAYSDDDRDEIISKMAEEFGAESDYLISKAEQLEDALLAMQEQQEIGEFVELAKSYGYGDEEAEVIGVDLYEIAVNAPEAFETVERTLASQAEIAKAYTQEIGFSGYDYESEPLGLAMSYADEIVAKSDGLITEEQAMTELFAANPDLYDQYMNER